VRLFFAAPLPEEEKRPILDLQEQLREIGVVAKWVEPENLHITVLFLGERSGDDEPRQAARDLAVQISPVTVRLGTRIMALPPRGEVRNIVLHMDEGEGELRRWHDQLSSALHMPADHFLGHLTLGRPRLNPPNLRQLAATVSLQQPVEFRAGSLTLFESTLTREGPIYRPRDIFSAGKH
jgi:2'-5' RNA ligase